MSQETPPNIELMKLELLRRRLAKSAKPNAQAGGTSIPKADRNAELPLSWSQQRLWFLNQFDQAAGSAYHMPVALRLIGELDVVALQAAMDRIVARHENLRTVFVKAGESARLEIRGEEVGLPLVHHDLSVLEPGQRQAQVEGIGAEEASKSFDLSNGPLIRGRLLKLGEREHVLLVTQHHIVSDGWSIGVLIGEFSELYSGFLQNRPDPLPALPIQYADYAAWQRQWLHGDELSKRIEFWRNHLQGAPALLELPSDRPRPPTQSYAGDRVSVRLPDELTESLRSFSQRHGATIYMTLLTGWSALLSRLSGQTDLVVGSPVANRQPSQVESLVGCFVNTLALRISLGDDPSAAQLIEQIKRTALSAYAHQELPFDQVVEALQPERSMSYSPLFQVMLTLDNTPRGASLSLPGLELTQIDPDHRTAHFDLRLLLSDAGAELAGELEYASDLFDRDSVERMVAQWFNLLQAMCEDEGRPLSVLPLISAEERRRVLVDFNTSHPDAHDRTLVDLFVEQVAGTPDAPAVSFDGRTLSYAELDARANQIAHRLIGLGVKPNERVAICVERGVEMVVGLIGILKSGAGYVPLDPSYPLERLSYMLADSEPMALLTQASVRPLLGALSVQVVELEDPTLAQESTQAPSVALNSSHLAYMIYTSGSTGQPKGVMIEHRSPVNFWHAMQATTHREVAPGARIGLNAAYAFDMSLKGLLQLLSGHCVLPIPQSIRASGPALLEFIETQKIDALDSTPSQLEGLLAAGLLEGEGHRPVSVLLGGEPIGPKLWAQLHSSKRIHFHNMYGPTECTVDATIGSIREATGGPVIGRPIANTPVYVLDARGEPVPIGVVGELHLGGVQVARGYWNRPELTAERFVRDPFSADPQARMYKTSDLGRWLSDGTIEYLGRNDFQVKIRGFRIELGEIEAKLVACEGVREAVVIAREDVEGDKRLVAYAVMEPGVELSVSALRESLSKDLAEYMVPSAFVALESLPLTPNGKLDRKALPAPDQDSVMSRAFEAPQSDAEIAIAEVWQELLGLEKVGRNDQFFELGGHSLLVIGLIERLRQRGYATDVRTVFTAPVLRALAEQLAGEPVAATPQTAANPITEATTRITPDLLPLVTLSQNEIDGIVESVAGGVRNLQDIYPLAPLQEGILFHHLLEQDSEGDAYLMRSVVAFESRERLDLFVAALQKVIQRHDILRSSVRWQGLPRPVQVVHREASLPVETLVLAQDQDVLAQVLERTDPRRMRLDLTRAPVLRGYIAQDAANGEWLLALLRHHLVCDHVAMDLILSEIQTLLSGGTLPAARAYRHFIAQMQTVAEDEHEAYFREQLATVEEPTAPFGILNVQNDGGRVEEARLPLSAQMARAIREGSRRRGVTPAVLFHVAWARVLGQCSGREDDVVFGTVLSGRLQGSEGADQVVGMFLNTLPIRIGLGADAPASIAQVYAQLSELLEHEQASLALAQRCSGVQAPLPLFTSLLNYRHGHAASPEDSAHAMQAWSGMRLVGGDTRNNYPLTMSVEDMGEGFGLTVLAVAGIDAQRLVRYMEQALTSLLSALEIGSPDVLRSLPILPASERETVLREFNATRPDSHDRTLVDLFVEQVARTPDAPAVSFDGWTLSYAELEARANQIAHRLIGLGVKPNERVAICVERGVEMVVGLIGILKSGGGYVPLDPSYPLDRLSYMLADSAPMALLTQALVRPLLGELSVPVVELEDATLAKESKQAPSVALNSSHLAYMIYTSGSTGQPKGVMIEHRSPVNFWHAMQASTHSEVAPGSRIGLNAAYAFDMSLKGLLQLLSGHCVLPIPQSIRASGPALLEFIETQRIDALDSTPSQLEGLLAAGLLEGEGHRPVSMLLGGEPIGPKLWAQLHSSKRIHFHNMYGPTECTVDATIGSIREATGGPVIGRPIANTPVYVLDGRGEPVPIGVVGELHLGGVQVARGYWNRPELTAERFVRDPFSADPQARMYKTGDLGRWLSDGTIEYLGRNDFQVKIRGFRIELGEIEAKLVACEDVREAVVIAREDVEGDKRLVAYVVMEPGVELSVLSLRESLSKELAEYMVPSAFVALEVLPLTPNGKLDRKALPAPDQGAVLSREYEAPVGEIETAIADIWQDLLGLERVGRHDHFFELGGHSLLAVQVASRLRQSLNLEIPLRDLFSRPTPAALAASVHDAQTASQPPITIADRSNPLPLSWAQQRLWFLDQLDHLAGAAYHMPVALQLSGELDRAALQASLNRIVARHENLRTRFVSQSGAPVQVIDAADSGFSLVDHDLSDLAADAQASAVATQSREEARASFDLAQGPLIRGRLLRLSEHEHVLLVTQHHIVSDGWSIGVLVHEVSVLYDAFRQGQADPLPPLPIQYADYAAWQRGWLQGETLQRQTTYWRDQLRGAPAVLELPTDRPRPPVQSYAGDRVAVRLSNELSAQLRSLSQRHGTTVFMTLLAGWSVLLSRLSGQSDVVVGSPVANRQRSELEPLIGFFVNTLALRVNLDQQPSVSDLLKQVKATTLAAYEHQDLPFEQVVEAVQPARSMSHSPLFQALLSLNNTPDGGGLQLHGLTLSQLDSGQQTAQFDLALSLTDNGNALSGSVAYASDLFDRTTVERMMDHWTTLLTAMVADDTASVARLPLLTAPQRAQVLQGFHAQAHGDTPRSFDRGVIHHGFEAQVARTPDAPAVSYEQATLSYAELDRRANQVAHRLIELGVKPDDRVAICVERSLDMVVGLLGILKAGGGYVPLDPAYPADRLAYMLEDSAPVALLSQSTLRVNLPASTCPVLELDDEAVWSQSRTDTPAVSGLQPHQLAYVIYTSGSTGQPKGVMVEHGDVSRLFASTDHWFGFNENDVWTLFHSFAFDFSVWELWGALLYGGRVVVVPSLCARSPSEFYELLVREGVTVLNQTPSAFRALIAAQSQHEHKLRTIVFGGEALELSTLTPWLQRNPTSKTQLINMYGITEITVHATYRPITEADVAVPRGSPIGQAIADLRLYVLDGQGEPVPVGVTGELYVAGAGVARGYLNREELTAQRFLSDRFDPDPRARMYKTGDLGRWLADGTIEYLGRNDFQVKIRGFRIELGEIEAKLAACEGVRDAVVIAREDTPGDKRLVAYLVMREGATWSVPELREALSRDLAEYMVPSAFVALESLPLTTNGKLDRQALPAPDQASVSQREYEAPQGETEIAIAEVWQDLLGLDRVGRHDHFFELGGHSLLVIGLIERLRQRGLNADVRTVFIAPVLSALAESLRAKPSAVDDFEVPANLIPDNFRDEANEADTEEFHV